MTGGTPKCNIRPLSAADLTSVLRLVLLVREAPSWTYEDFRKLLGGQPEEVSSGVIVPDATLLRRAWIAEQIAEPSGSRESLILGLAVVQCLRVGGIQPTDAQTEVEAELESILVHPDARRHGIGSLLLNTVTEWCRGRHHAAMLRLEVRSSNQAALALYHRHGFRITGHRPRYYRHPEEDAVLMELTFKDLHA